jgi:hypothetical protein
MVLNSGLIIRAPSPRGYDGVVSVDERSDYNTLQAADDVLDAAAYSLYVKQGTYAAGLTVSTNNVYIFVEPGTVIQAAITLSGDNVTLVLGAGCDVQGLITMSGANCSLICHNGVDTDGILMSGNFGFHDGGGLETLHNGGTANDAIRQTGTDCLAQNCAVQTTAGGGNSLDGVSAEGDRSGVRNVKVIDSDDAAITLVATSNFAIECTILGADGKGIVVGGGGGVHRVMGNHVKAVGGVGIDLRQVGDNSLVTGNIVQDQGSTSVVIDAASEDCLVVGNKLDGAVTDNSGTSTVASNEVTAF